MRAAHTTKSALCAAVLLAALAAGSAASGQAARAPTPPQQQEARTLFEQGLEAADAERWAEAVLFFQRSYAIVPRPSTQLNLGNALVRMGRVREARDALTAVLRDADPRRDGERITRARAMLAEAERAVSRLRVEVRASGGASLASVTLTVDGAPRDERPDAQSAWEITVDPGPHVVGARTPDGASGEARVTALPGGRAALQVELRPATAALSRPGPARLRFTGAPAAAAVWVDGSERGAATEALEVEPGEHEVDVRVGSRSIQRQRVRVRPGDTVQVLVLASAEPARQPRSVLASPVFWTVAGVLVAGGVAGAAAAVLLSGGEYNGTTGDKVPVTGGSTMPMEGAAP